MNAGDINITTLTIGSLNLLDPSVGTLVGFNIYESILQPLGPHAEIRFLDYNDSIVKSNINGKEDVTISFSNINTDTVTYKFKLLKKNYNDKTDKNQASGLYKEIDFHLVTAEFLNSQGNRINYSNETQTSSMVNDMLTKFLKTDKQVDIQEQTKGNRRLVFKNEHFIDVYRKLNNEHVSSDHKSSCYATFVQGGAQQKYVFATFEKLFEGSTVATLKQQNTLATKSASEDEKQNSIMWFKAPETFNTLPRSFSVAQKRGYDPTTGKGFNQKPQPEPKFVTADSSKIYDKPPNDANFVPVHTILDSSNNKEQTYVDDARKYRTMFLSHLAQNYADMEVPGNSNIKLGTMIQMDIPNKNVNNKGQDQEKQMDGKALVVNIRHKIRPNGTSPRHTMILRVVKGSWKEGGGGNG